MDQSLLLRRLRLPMDCLNWKRCFGFVERKSLKKKKLELQGQCFDLFG